MPLRQFSRVAAAATPVRLSSSRGFTSQTFTTGDEAATVKGAWANRLHTTAIKEKETPSLKPMVFGTRVRKSPFFDATVKSEVAEFTIYNKTLLPLTWGSQSGKEEYENLCNNVCLWDVSCQRQVELRGKDAARLAQLLSARNLSNFKPGQAKYVICTDRKGTVINDPLVLKLADDRFWFSIADRDFELWAQAHADALDMKVDVSELEVPVMAVVGPRSRDLMADVFGSDVVGDLKFFHFRKVEWHGVPSLVTRAGWCPELGFEIYPLYGEGRDRLPKATGGAMWDELVEKGKAHKLGFGTPNQPRRLEGGMISSCDYEATSLNALEMGLPSHMVNLDMTPNFVGKAALQAIRTSATHYLAEQPTGSKALAHPGASRLMVGIQFDTDQPITASMHETWDIRAPLDGAADGAIPGEVVGKVTSMAYSPRVGANIGLATIKANLADPGTPFVVVTPEGMRNGVVAQLPFPGTARATHKSTNSAPF